MTLEEFTIGEEFWIWTGLEGDAEWIRCVCTDKGTRTIAYQKIEPVTVYSYDMDTKEQTTRTYSVEEAFARGEFSPASWDAHVDCLLNDYEFDTCSQRPDLNAL